MINKVKELNSLDDLEQALKDSSRKPVLFFKHSSTCPISARAYREFADYLKSADDRVEYRLVTVQVARPVSNEIAARLHVRHETPQAILVKEGREVWSASHFDITSSTLEEAIRAN